MVNDSGVAFSAVVDVLLLQRGDRVSHGDGEEATVTDINGGAETGAEMREKKIEHMRGGSVGKERDRESEKEPGEISDESGGCLFMESEQEKEVGSEDEMESPVAKKRKYSPKHSSSKAVDDGDTLYGPEVPAAVVVTAAAAEMEDSWEETGDAELQEMETVSLEGKKSSRSKKSSRKSSQRRRKDSHEDDSHKRSRRSRSRDRVKRSRSIDKSKRSRSRGRSKRSRSRERSKRSRSRERSKRSRSRESVVVKQHSTRADSRDRKRRSRSRESLRERKGDDRIDVKRRSKSRESPLEQTPKEDIKVERRSRRSRSTESLRDLKGNGREDSRHARTQTRERSRERSHRNNERAHGRVGSVERRRRSRSNESMPNSKAKDSLERKHGSPSKERVRERVREKEREGDDSAPSKEQVRDRVREKEREGDDGGHDSKRYGSRTGDLPTLSRRSDRHEQEFSGHGGGWPRERSHKEAGDRIRADSISMDRRPRSHSRESVREWEHRDGGSKRRQNADEAYERSSTRYSGRGKESHDRGYNYAHDARNGSHQAGGRDSSYGGADKDRNRDKSYGQDQKYHSRDETKQNLDKKARSFSA